MWWERLIPRSYLYKQSVFGIECIYDDSNINFNVVILYTKKNNLVISEKHSGIDINTLQTIYKKHKYPAIISVSGKGIISKKVIYSSSEVEDLQEFIQQNLPAISKEEFYVQLFKGNNESGFLTTCRKHQIDELIQKLKGAQVEIFDVYIGPMTLLAIHDLLKNHKAASSSLYQFDLNEGFIDNVSTAKEQSTTLNRIENLEIENAYLLPFSAAFSYLTQKNIYDSLNTELSDLKSKIIEQLKIKFLIGSSVAFLFILSAINSVLFFNKYEESSEIETKLNLYESKNKQIATLLENYQKKKSLIEQAGILENKKISLFADKIASTLPQEIVLTELYFNPTENEENTDSLLKFKENCILIKGNCSKSILLNDWINVLKNQNFIQTVNLENYIYNSSDVTLPNFTIKIDTK